MTADEGRDIDWTEVKPEERLLSLSTLRFSNDTQPRVEMIDDYVDDLSDKMQVADNGIVVDRKGREFPPLEVFYDGDDYWVADGHHRGRAAKQIGAEQIQVHLYQGTKDDAIKYAAGANDSHGRPRTREDEITAILQFLLDDEWRYWSDREIARQCSVNHQRVSRKRRELIDRDPEYAEDVGNTRKFKRDGEVHEMNTASDEEEGDESDDDGDEGGATWTLKSDISSDKGEDDENSELDEDSSTGVYEEETNFETIPTALECAEYAQYDPIGKTTVAWGCNIRSAFEEIGPIDLVVSHGPDGLKEYNSWVEACVHHIGEHGTIVAILDPDTYTSRAHKLENRFKHCRTQLIDMSDEWCLASIWNTPLNGPNRMDLTSKGWPDWSSTLYRSGMDNIAVPYARSSHLAAGLIGPDREVNVLTQSKEDVDEIVSRL